MASLIDSIDGIKTIEDGLVANKVAKFSYTQCAYDTNDVNGVSEYNYQHEQNIPLPDASTLKVNETTLNKGYRSQASSITRMLLNHFFGRVSYNLNKVNDNFSSLLTSLKAYIGRANGVASLDENGRIPYSQLPETAQELKGTWNASTNVWTGYDGATGSLISGTGDIGDTYIVTTEGWFDSATGQSSATAVTGYEHYLVNGRIMYNGTDWVNISGGSQYALCNENYFRAGAGSSVGNYGVSIGCSSTSGDYGVSIGCSSTSGNYGVSIGFCSNSSGGGVAIGRCACDDSGVAIGFCAHGVGGVTIGNRAVTTCANGISIGYLTCSGNLSVAIGQGAIAYTSSVAIGYNSSCCNTSGANNVTIGIQSASAIASGSARNVVIGSSTMSTGAVCPVNDTVIIGSCAGHSNKTSENVFIGSCSGYNNTTGCHNTFIGTNSGCTNNTGFWNTFIGAFSGQNNTTGCFNIFVGTNSGQINTTGCCNTFIGVGSGGYNTIGGYNVFIGTDSGFANTTGNCNIFIGICSGAKNSSGCDNTFIGSCSGYSNTTGESNTFVGLSSGKCNLTGSYNTFMGETAGAQNITGSSNTFIGGLAGCQNEGWDNTFIGARAGSDETNRKCAVIVGSVLKVCEDRAFAIGYEDPAGVCNNYLFTCGSNIYWCFGSSRFAVQTTLAN